MPLPPKLPESAVDVAPEGGLNSPEDIKAANATSFWARWTGTEGTASLQTGRGNRLVTRSLRDAREDAVCMVTAGTITGCGFLVQFKGHLAVLTNNHILETPALAAGAIAAFSTAAMGTVEVALYPDKLFVCSPKDALDYTLVACAAPPGVQVLPQLSLKFSGRSCTSLVPAVRSAGRRSGRDVSVPLFFPVSFPQTRNRGENALFSKAVPWQLRRTPSESWERHLQGLGK